MPEPRTPFVSSALQEAVIQSYTEEISRHVREQQAQYLDPENTLEFQHGVRWNTPANSTGDASGEVQRHSVATELQLMDVVKGDPLIMFEMTLDAAKGMLASIEQMLFSKVTESTERSGNTVNARDHEDLFEAFLASLEKMEMSLDEDGKLNLPTFFVHPQGHQEIIKKLQSPTPEMLERLENLKAKKLDDANKREEARIKRFESRAE